MENLDCSFFKSRYTPAASGNEIKLQGSQDPSGTFVKSKAKVKILIKNRRLGLNIKPVPFNI